MTPEPTPPQTLLEQALETLQTWTVWFRGGRYAIRHAVDGDSPRDADWQRIGEAMETAKKALSAVAAGGTPPLGELPKLKSRELRKGTGDVLKDLAHAERMTDTSEPGFGEVICCGRDLDFVNRVIRVAKGEIVQLRQRLEKRPAAASAVVFRPEPTPSAPAVPAFDFQQHLQRQREFSERTFGPGLRTKGVCDHIRKELDEIERAPEDLSEWADVVILGLDGFWRAGATPEQIIAAIVAKQTKNEARTWPDWCTQPLDKAIEHDRSDERGWAQPTSQEGAK